jgi:hypothetical protein
MSLNGQFQFRRDSAANWSSANPVLLSGELGLETDTDQFKIGDGTSTWNMLPYGGLQGPQGVQGIQGEPGRGIVSITRTAGNGAAGTTDTYTITYTDSTTSTFTVRNGSSVVVGTTNTVTPVTAPSVTDADAGENVSLTFNLPRARNVAAGTTTTGNAGTNASVSSAQDANGDVTLNFTIPRGDTGATGPAANAFTNIAVTGQNTVSADQANDTLTLVAGANISIVTNDVTDSVTISSTAVAQNTFAVVTGNTGTATADQAGDTLAITGGTGISTAATDTPDGLVITNTGVTSVTAGTGIGVSAATGGVTISNTGVTSVNGATGAVTVGRADIPAPTLTNATATLTTEQVVARWTIPANFLQVGDAIRIRVATQTAAASVLTVRLRAGATGTATDGQVVILTASAAQAANAYQTWEFLAYVTAVGATGSIRGSGNGIAQAAVLGTPTAANAAVTINTTAAVNIQMTLAEGTTAGVVTIIGAGLFVGD